MRNESTYRTQKHYIALSNGALSQNLAIVDRIKIHLEQHVSKRFFAQNGAHHDTQVTSIGVAFFANVKKNTKEDVN